MTFLETKQFAKEFKLENVKLGSGNFGSVQRVVKIASGERLAMKTIFCNDSDNLSSAFSELLLSFKMDHKHIVTPKYYHIETIIGYANGHNNHLQRNQPKRFQNQQQAFECNNMRASFNFHIIMELGQNNLLDQIQRCIYNKLRFSQIELVDMMRGFVDTLAQLQQSNIAHRDIKPENILFCNGVYKITDFGLAMLTQEDSFYDYAGSPLYVSPLLKGTYMNKFKNFNFHNVFKSDVYSLGMTILHAVACQKIDGLNDPDDKGQKTSQLLNHVYHERLYDTWLLQILSSMTQHDEKARPDFIELQANLTMIQQMKQQDQAILQIEQCWDEHGKMVTRMVMNQKGLNDESNFFINEMAKFNTISNNKILDKTKQKPNLNDQQCSDTQLHPNHQPFQNIFCIPDANIKNKNNKQTAKNKNTKIPNNNIIYNMRKKFINSIQLDMLVQIKQTRINKMCFLSENKYLLVAFDNGDIGLFDALNDLKRLSLIEKAHNCTYAITAYQEPDEQHYIGKQNKTSTYRQRQNSKNNKGYKFFFSAGKDGLIKIWDYSDINNVKLVHVMDQTHNGAVTCLSYMRNLNVLITGSSDKTINCFYILVKNINVSFLQHTFVPIAGSSQESILSLDVYATHNKKNQEMEYFLFSGGAKGTMNIYNLQTLQLESSIKEHEKGIFSLQSVESMEGRRQKFIVSGGGAGEAFLYNFKTKEVISRLEVDEDSQPHLHFPAIQNLHNEYNTVCVMDNIGILHFWDPYYELQHDIELCEVMNKEKDAADMVIKDNWIYVATNSGLIAIYQISFNDEEDEDQEEEDLESQTS